MEPPRSPDSPLAGQEEVHHAADVDTISVWDFLQEYCHIDVDAIARSVATTAMPREMDVIDVDGDAPLQQPEDKGQKDDVMLALGQPLPGQHGCRSAPKEESMGSVAAQPVGMNPENVTSAGYIVPLSPPAGKMLVAAAADPLQLSLSNDMPGRSGINLNLPPPEKPYERPLLGLIGRKDPPPFVPVILESSEVAKSAADQTYELFPHPNGAARYKKTRRIEQAGVAVVPSVNSMAPAIAKHKRRYTWPANKVAKLDAKIEQLRKEALLRPAQRRSLTLIQQNIDELQAQKDEIHARMLDVMRDNDREGCSSSSGDQHAPPTGN